MKNKHHKIFDDNFFFFIIIFEINCFLQKCIIDLFHLMQINRLLTMQLQKKNNNNYQCSVLLDYIVKWKPF